MRLTATDTGTDSKTNFRKITKIFSKKIFRGNSKEAPTNQRGNGQTYLHSKTSDMLHVLQDYGYLDIEIYAPFV